MSARHHHPGLNLGNTDPETHEAAESLLFGFWIFLMSDLVLFALLFATYAATSQHGIAGGPTPADLFELKNPFIETLLLLVSSFTFGLAALALKYRQDRSRLMFWLVVTFLLGAGFVVMEARDFMKMASEGHTPQQSAYLSAFFALVGTHGLHVTAGLMWILIMLVQVLVFGLAGEVKTRLLRLAIFWHMLDIVWICIFTFVYLFGVSQ
ncbi:cytochrome o ubiquinol oxidase subunit III [Halomonas sp. GXIMD04776]|uniref:cytochrome o ubiquinol oxidase subunit III n=1 Tax=Halomonas sp. GXIMD04776 TaxID=3415605 RepID=UPI003C8DEEAC